MRWHFDLEGAEPVIRDCPIYDATNLENGELLMLGVSGTASADCSVALVTAYGSGTAAAAKAAGILNDSRWGTGATAPSAVYSSDTATGGRFGKVIINPKAVYLAEYTTANAVAVTSTSGTVCLQSGMAGTTNIQGHFLYFTGTAAGVKYSLRMCNANTAATYATLDSALTVSAGSADTMMKVWRPNYALTTLSADGLKLDGGAAAEGTGTHLRTIDSFIQDDTIPFQPLRRKQHAGLNNLSNPHFYSQIVMLDPLF